MRATEGVDITGQTDNDARHGSVEIKFRLPHHSRLIPRPSTVVTVLSRVPDLSRRTLVIGGLGLVVVSAVITASALSGKQQPDENHLAASGPLDRLERGTPSYSTLLPAGKSLEELGGWTRVSPSQTDPVYAYTDTIDGVPISVSQQPLPDDLKKDTDQKIQQLAYDFRANQKLTVGQTSLYVGSATDGPQSVILHKDGLLILMKSNARIDAQKWGKYADSLR